MESYSSRWPPNGVKTTAMGIGEFPITVLACTISIFFTNSLNARERGTAIITFIQSDPKNKGS